MMEMSTLIIEFIYCQTSNISHNKIVDHSDIVGASPVGAAPTTSSFFLSSKVVCNIPVTFP